jgi:hypothetical protein
MSRPYSEIEIRGICMIKFHREYPGMMNSDMALKAPIRNPTKLVTLRTYLLTLGKINVRIAITTGVVGQNITPKDDVSNSKGLKLGLKSALIGDQNANTAKGITQYLHKGSLLKTYTF